MLNGLILHRSIRHRLSLVGLLCLVVHPFTFAFATALLAQCAFASCENEPPDGSPRTVYFTVGDAQDLLEFAPLDSRTSIATAFETLSRGSGCLVTDRGTSIRGHLRRICDDRIPSTIVDPPFRWPCGSLGLIGMARTAGVDYPINDHEKGRWPCRAARQVG